MAEAELSVSPGQVHLEGNNSGTLPSAGSPRESDEQMESAIKEDGQTDSRKEQDEMSHKDAMMKLQNGLSKIIQEDPLLCDLPKLVTLDEVKSKIALEYGQAMMVNVRKADGDVMPVAVVHNGTVRDLKNAIKRYISLKLERDNIKKSMNWTYVWNSYLLQFNGQKLEDDNKPVKEYGIRNKDEVIFMRRLRKK